MVDSRSAQIRSIHGPLRVIDRVELVPFGSGHMRVFLLRCGHQVEHLQRYDLKVGKVTGCPACKER